MDNEKYDEIISSVIEKESIFKNVCLAFFSGGVVGIIAEFLNGYFMNYFDKNYSSVLVFITFITIGSILTGLGFFDKVLSYFKCGLIVPPTGFANTMTSSAMDARSEGLVKGIGASIFKLTGSIILYGIVFGIIFGFIRGIIL